MGPSRSGSPVLTIQACSRAQVRENGGVVGDLEQVVALSRVEEQVLEALPRSRRRSHPRAR